MPSGLTTVMKIFKEFNAEIFTADAKALLNDSPEFINETLELSKDKIEESLGFVEEYIEMLRGNFEYDIEEDHEGLYRVLKDILVKS